MRMPVRRDIPDVLGKSFEWLHGGMKGPTANVYGSGYRYHGIIGDIIEKSKMPEREAMELATESGFALLQSAQRVEAASLNLRGALPHYVETHGSRGYRRRARMMNLDINRMNKYKRAGMYAGGGAAALGVGYGMTR